MTDSLLSKFEELLDRKLATNNEKIGRLIIFNNEKLLLAVDEKIKAAEDRLVKQIEASQQDTIETLTELMNTGYNNHEARIDRIEGTLSLPPLKTA